MKKLLLVMCSIFMIISVNAQTDETASEGGPVLTFEELTLDYGTVEYSADGKRSFTFTNTGTEPLIISRCKGSCGCTVPTCPTEPIMPGETGNIDVKYDTKRPGPFTKSITVTSNAETQTVLLKIKGTVKQADLDETAPVKDESPVVTPHN